MRALLKQETVSILLVRTLHLNRVVIGVINSIHRKLTIRQDCGYFFKNGGDSIYWIIAAKNK